MGNQSVHSPDLTVFLYLLLITNKGREHSLHLCLALSPSLLLLLFL